MSADGGKEAVAADGAFGVYIGGSRFGSHGVGIGFERAGLCVIEQCPAGCQERRGALHELLRWS